MLTIAKLLTPVTGYLFIGAMGILSCNEPSQKHPDRWKDLNKNNKLDIYEDTSRPVEARVNDLLGQMTLEEKAGLLFINGARVNDDGSIEDKPGKGLFAFAPNAMKLMKEKRMNHFNLWAIPSTAALAKW